MIRIRPLLPSLFAFVAPLLFPHFAGAQAAPAVNPQSLVRETGEIATVSRLKDGRFLVRWTSDARRTEVFVGATPDVSTNKPVAIVNVSSSQLGTNEVAITTTVAPRPYFRLRFQGGSKNGTIVVTERFLPLVGAANVRDLGGYKTASGKSVRWGKVYRANALSGLTDTDLQFLGGANGLKTVCDLRGDSEVKAAPDRLPSGTNAPRTLRLPIDSGQVSGDQRKLMAVILSGDAAALNTAMGDGYVRIIDECAETVWGPMLKEMAQDKNAPFVFHCTAGKDRTGIASALLLSLLGVPRETVVADYSLTNTVYDALLAELKENKGVKAMGMDPARLSGALIADPAWLERALTHIDTKYGGIEKYLKTMAKLDDATIAQIKANLLQ